jgi:hypothetical protein
MWPMLLKYAVPIGVAVYGLVVLATGTISGFRDRVARGAKARVLGVLLIVVAAVAVAVDPKSPFGPTSTRADLDALQTDVGITLRISELRSRELDWARANTPARPAPGDDPDVELERSEEFLRAMEAFTAERKQRAAETDRKIKELEAERTRIREQREAAAARRQESGSGSWLLALGGLLGAWGLAWLAGRPQGQPAPPPDVPAAADQGPAT